MSSRRDSRVHLSIRQNDALLEFENFKRKYLLVNKHITKLNSTLSVRVEELNAQVSTLYVENLRLRASEISLVSQLKKEKERTRRVVDGAESAVGILMEHLSEMRTSLCGTSTNVPSSPKRKVPVSMVQPPREAIRLVRPPAETITQIPESEEDDVDEEDTTPTRTVASRHPSANRLPLSTLVSTRQSTVAMSQTAIPQINLAGATRRKPVKRNGSLLCTAQPPAVERAPSPVAVPMTRLRRRSSECEAEEREVELEVQVGVEPEKQMSQETPKVNEEEVRVDLGAWIVESPKQSDRKGKGKQAAADRERETELQSVSERDSSEGSKERIKEKDKRRCGIKDVTNSPRRKGLKEFVEETPIELSAPISPPILTTPSSANAELFDVLTPKAGVSLLSSVSTPATDGGSEVGENVTGRERRTRKSVNYAEPKLNTKMRKPDPPPESFKARTSAGGTAPRRRRSISSQNAVLASDEDGDADVEGSGLNLKWMEGRRKTVHNTIAKTSDPSSSVEPAGSLGDSYGHWGDEARRHSMAV